MRRRSLEGGSHTRIGVDIDISISCTVGSIRSISSGSIINVDKGRFEFLILLMVHNDWTSCHGITVINTVNVETIKGIARPLDPLLLLGGSNEPIVASFQ
jgi:hypothetical protein